MNPYGILAGLGACVILGIVSWLGLIVRDLEREVRSQIDKNVDTRERLPLKEVPYSPTGMFVNGDMLEEIRKHDEAREASLPVLSLSCVTPQGDIVEEEP